MWAVVSFVAIAVATFAFIGLLGAIGKAIDRKD